MEGKKRMVCIEMAFKFLYLVHRIEMNTPEKQI